jgi:hypothetical protein
MNGTPVGTVQAMSQSQNGRPAEPADYAALNLVYGALLAGLIVATRKRPQSQEPIPTIELLPMSAATFALAKVIAREKIGTWVREPFVDEDSTQRRPRGRGLRRAMGELVTCTRCVGAWSALGIVGLRVVEPRSGRIVTNVLAASAANDWLQAAFKMLTSETNAVSRRADETVPEQIPAR